MKVLCGIDGSSNSDAAVRLLGQLLSPTDDEVLFYYSPPQIALRGSSQPSAQVMQKARESLVQKVVDRAKSLLPVELAERSTHVTDEKKPQAGIPAVANAQRVDLIALGARGTSSYGLPRLGSVSRTVVNSTTLPVLVARPRRCAESDPLELLVCYDPNGLNESTVAVLNELSPPGDAVGRGIHVVESPFTRGVPDWLAAEARRATHDPLARAFVEEQDADLDSWPARIEEQQRQLPAAFRSQPPAVFQGHAGEQIVAYTESQEVDLVVVGARVMSALGRLLSGSTSEHVLAHAACSVLIIPHSDAG